MAVQKMNNEWLLAIEHPKSVHGGHIWEPMTSALNKTRKRRQVATDINLVQCGCVDVGSTVSCSPMDRGQILTCQVYRCRCHTGVLVNSGRPIETTEKYDSALIVQAFIFKASENRCTSHCTLCPLSSMFHPSQRGDVDDAIDAEPITLHLKSAEVLRW